MNKIEVSNLNEKKFLEKKIPSLYEKFLLFLLWFNSPLSNIIYFKTFFKKHSINLDYLEAMKNNIFSNKS